MDNSCMTTSNMLSMSIYYNNRRLGNQNTLQRKKKEKWEREGEAHREEGCTVHFSSSLSVACMCIHTGRIWKEEEWCVCVCLCVFMWGNKWSEANDSNYKSNWLKRKWKRNAEIFTDIYIMEFNRKPHRKFNWKSLRLNKRQRWKDRLADGWTDTQRTRVK